VSINILHDSVRVGAALYPNAEVKDVLAALARKLTRK
jgi:hypothetical protein